MASSNEQIVRLSEEDRALLRAIAKAVGVSFRKPLGQEGGEQRKAAYNVGLEPGPAAVPVFLSEDTVRALEKALRGNLTLDGRTDNGEA